MSHDLLSWFLMRRQQVNSLEILAVLGSILTYHHLFRDRDVLFFVHNMTVLKICVNGYDRHADIAHLSNAIHLALAGLSSRVYFEWVPGKDNQADLPSRADFIANPATGLITLDTCDFTDKDRAVMQKQDAVQVPMVLSQLHQLDNLSFWITFGKKSGGGELVGEWRSETKYGLPPRWNPGSRCG